MSFRPRILDEWAGARRLADHLRQHTPSGNDTLRLRVSIRKGHWLQAKFIVGPKRLRVVLCDRKSLADEARYTYYAHALPAVIHVLSRARPPMQIKAEIGDGSADVSDQIAFSAIHAATVLLPDPAFFNSRGYAAERDEPPEQRPWPERDDTIVWRGATTGWDRGTREPLEIEHPDTIQRVRMCALLNGQRGADVKIYWVVPPLSPQTDVAILTKAGLMGDWVPPDSWHNRKFALDVDGNANAFSNLFVRLLLGCCVIKVASPRNYRQWYYDRLVPWTHYVPVSADLSDLLARIEWCRTHTNECHRIAMAGQALARSMTFESEMQDAVARLNARWG